MSRSSRFRLGALALLASVSGWTTASSGEIPSFGAPIAPTDKSLGLAIPPSGEGLPPGRGTAADGRAVYATHCVACHGDKLQGIKATGAAALIGGRGTLRKPVPLKTVESYWPYATTLFDYVKRAMPFNAPGSLSDAEVYAVTAYILSEGKVISASDTMDARSLPRVRMPNADGFIPDPRPASGTP